MSPIFDELPTKLGHYTLTERLCSRERSELYAATQSYVDRTVVIEVLRSGYSDTVVEHFRESARRRAAVTLGHVSPVLEAAQTGNYSYVVQEKPAGKSLSALLGEGGGLSYKQGFALAQAVAELYSACIGQNLAALPLDLASVYLENDVFSFLSPLEEGTPADADRVAQMTALAEILEQVVPNEVLTVSKLAVVVHWLRNGYGGVVLEWQHLLGALNSLRLQKNTRHKSGEQRKSKSLLHYAKWRYVKRALRAPVSGKRGLAFYAVGVLVTAVVSALIRFYLCGPETLPAVTDDYVYCLCDGIEWRVHSNPVSISEYTDFLAAFNSMSPDERQRLHIDMPAAVDEHTPIDWDKQQKAASDAPVCGVSYWDALAYARYRREAIPNARLVKTVRKYVTPPHATEEWTSTQVPERFPLSPYYVVMSANSTDIVPAVDPARREKQRGFRTAQNEKK